jgi:glycosyltransferase involved in cell wall biosynthesis
MAQYIQPKSSQRTNLGSGQFPESGESVLVYATQYMPTGGIESHLREFCLHLAESGIAIDLVINNSMMSPEVEAFFRRICKRVYLGKKNRWWLPWVGLQLLGKRYNVLYTNGQGNSIGLIANLLPRRIRWVHHHHTAGDAADYATWGHSYKNALQNADMIVACSSRNANDMKTIINRSVQSIPCFSREISVQKHEPKTKLRFGYYGRLIPEKGIDILCELSLDTSLEAIEFHIWGEGERYPPSFFVKFPRIHYHGPFYEISTLKEILANLDAYLLISSHPEGLPIALLEVMSAGLPWLATDRGGVADIACDPVATRVISNNATYEEVKTSILNLASDIHEGKISGSVQKSLYSTMFSAQVLVVRWRQLMGLGPASNQMMASSGD